MNADNIFPPSRVLRCVLMYSSPGSSININRAMEKYTFRWTVIFHEFATKEPLYMVFADFQNF